MAQKFIAKSQWDKAVKELQKAVALDPGDVRTLLKLGDVYAKKGDRENATKTYKEVADSYSQQGFFLKAVAVHKQILKQDKDNLDVRLKLAELYEQLGLASEAQAQYQEMARIHDEKGNTRGSLDVLKRLVELDNENVASRIKLAEGFSRANQVEDAVQEFSKAAEVLKRQNRLDDYVKVAERLVFHDPDRIPVIKDLARLYLSRGDTKRGLAKLQLCFKAEPRDLETLTLLAQAFSELGQVQKTIFVYKELAAVYAENGMVEQAEQAHRQVLNLDPTDGNALAALGLGTQDFAQSGTHVPLSIGSPSQSSFAAQPLSNPASGPLAPRLAPRPPSQAVAGPRTNARPRTNPPPVPQPDISFEEPELLGHAALPEDELELEPYYDPASDLSPPPSPAPRPSLAPRPPAPTPAPPPRSNLAPPPVPPDAHRDVQEILTETDVFVRYGLTEKALAHLRRVFELDPDNPLAYEKMRDIYMSVGDGARAAEAVANLMHVHANRGDRDGVELARAQLARLAPGHPLAHGGLPGALPPPRKREEEELSIDIIEDSGVFELDDYGDHAAADGLSAPAALDPMADALVFDDEEPLHFEDPEPADDYGDHAALQADHGWGAPAQGHDDAWHHPEARVEPDRLPILDGPAFSASFPQSIVTGDLLTDPPAAAPGYNYGQHYGDDDAPMELTAEDELEAPDWNHPEGNDLSDPFLENVVTEFAGVEHQAALAAIVAARGNANHQADVDPLDPSTEDDLEALSDEADEDGSLSTLSGQAPTPPDVDDDLEEVSFYLDSELWEEAREALRLVMERAPDHPRAQELLQELEEGEARAEAEAAEAEAEDDDDEPETMTASNGVEEDFASLAGELEEEEVDDPENEYDMGMVMMDTMQFEQAIAHFERASRGPTRGLAALEMLGNCYRQKGQPIEAIEYYARALESGAEGAAASNLKYEIGAAYEEAGELTLSLEWMEKCAADDETHRDVEARIDSLVKQLGVPTNGASGPARSGRRGPTTGKKSKISYL
ncbi:MAG: tetratricopeptide repeat protein [Deltaproteobacteria bacterium]|nr:tetratricopeptide repeat protein [Deltaproteobacteria bacterium]